MNQKTSRAQETASESLVGSVIPGDRLVSVPAPSDTVASCSLPPSKISMSLSKYSSLDCWRAESKKNLIMCLKLIKLVYIYKALCYNQAQTRLFSY